MRIISFNANGIRSARRKGFFEWLAKQDAEIICIQEVRAQEEQLTEDCYYPDQYQCYYYDAQKKGYSGTAIYTRTKPLTVEKGTGWDPIDSEARWILARYNRINVASLYFPSGSAGQHRLDIKLLVMKKFSKILKSLINEDKPCIICADWNICHKEIDLANWRGNQKNSGFLPEERAWLDDVYDNIGWLDAFRVVCKEPHQYTWWSNRGQARAKNVGWRLDYPLITPDLCNKVQKAHIVTDYHFSDHAPLIMDYDINL